MEKIIPLENDNSMEDNFTTITPQQRALLEEMEGLPVISVDKNPTEILRSMRKEKRWKVTAQYGK